MQFEKNCYVYGIQTRMVDAQKMSNIEKYEGVSLEEPHK